MNEEIRTAVYAALDAWLATKLKVEPGPFSEQPMESTVLDLLAELVWKNGGQMFSTSWGFHSGTALEDPYDLCGLDQDGAIALTQLGGVLEGIGRVGGSDEGWISEYAGKVSACFKEVWDRRCAQRKAAYDAELATP